MSEIRVLGWLRDLFTNAVTVAAGVDAAGNMRVARHDPSETVAGEVAAATGGEVPRSIRIHDVVAETAPTLIPLEDEVLGAARRVIVTVGDDAQEAEIKLTAADGVETSFLVGMIEPLDRSLRGGFKSALIAATPGIEVRIEARYA